MVSRIIAAVDAEYAEVTRIRIRRAFRQLATEGRPNGGRVFGFVSAVGDDGRKTRVIVPHEADAVRWAAAEVLRGETLASIAQAFDARGLAHVRKGKTWSPTHVRNLVRNPAVAGLRPDPDGKLIPAIWPAILDATTWRNVRAALAQPVTLRGLTVASTGRRASVVLRAAISSQPDWPSAAYATRRSVPRCDGDGRAICSCRTYAIPAGVGCASASSPATSGCRWPDVGSRAWPGCGRLPPRRGAIRRLSWRHGIPPERGPLAAHRTDARPRVACRLGGRHPPRPPGRLPDCDRTNQLGKDARVSPWLGRCSGAWPVAPHRARQDRHTTAARMSSDD